MESVDTIKGFIDTALEANKKAMSDTVDTRDAIRKMIEDEDYHYEGEDGYAIDCKNCDECGYMAAHCYGGQNIILFFDKYANEYTLYRHDNVFYVMRNDEFICMYPRKELIDYIEFNVHTCPKTAYHILNFVYMFCE